MAQPPAYPDIIPHSRAFFFTPHPTKRTFIDLFPGDYIYHEPTRVFGRLTQMNTFAEESVVVLTLHVWAPHDPAPLTFFRPVYNHDDTPFLMTPTFAPDDTTSWRCYHQTPMGNVAPTQSILGYGGVFGYFHTYL